MTVVPSGFAAFETQLPRGRTSFGWAIERVTYADRDDLITVELVESLPTTRMNEARKVRIEIERAIAFRVSDEGNLCHYWEVRTREGIDPRTTVYTIRSSAYLDEVNSNYLLSDANNPLVHFLIAGDSACLEYIADGYTQMRISGGLEKSR